MKTIKNKKTKIVTILDSEVEARKNEIQDLKNKGVKVAIQATFNF